MFSQKSHPSAVDDMVRPMQPHPIMQGKSRVENEFDYCPASMRTLSELLPAGFCPCCPALLAKFRGFVFRHSEPGSETIKQNEKKE